MVQIKSQALLRLIHRDAVVILVLCLFGCHPSSGDSDKSNSTNASVGSLPPVGKVDDKAGFFVEVQTSRATRDKFNMHKGLTTFDDLCKGEPGQVIDCYLDAEEQSLFSLPFYLHYHVPSKMCSYVGIEPFYFVNRATKRVTSLTKFIDKNGLVGIDNDRDGSVETTDFGCYTEAGVPECCVGDYPEATFIWDSSAGHYGNPSTTMVHRTLEKCLGGPATKSQPKNSFGVPGRTLQFVENKGISDIYGFEELSKHNVKPAWVANFFDQTQHGGAVPAAFSEDIDPGVFVEKYGNPYYTFSCHDSGGETLAAIRVQIREWNTAAKYEERRSDPNGYNEVGNENDPWGQESKNDFFSWDDYTNAGTVHPGFDYR